MPITIFLDHFSYSSNPMENVKGKGVLESFHFRTTLKLIFYVQPKKNWEQDMSSTFTTDTALVQNYRCFQMSMPRTSICTPLNTIACVIIVAPARSLSPLLRPSIEKPKTKS